MSYYRLFYHLTWGTKNREPTLTRDIEPVIHGYLRSKAIRLGATVFALDGIEDHVHMVASIPPTIALSRFIGQVKGATSTRFNKSGISNLRFSWQEEYGIFTFGPKDLSTVVAYVESQKQHHAQKTTIRALERTWPPSAERSWKPGD